MHGFKAPSYDKNIERLRDSEQADAEERIEQHRLNVQVHARGADPITSKMQMKKISGPVMIRRCIIILKILMAHPNGLTINEVDKIIAAKSAESNPHGRYSNLFAPLRRAGYIRIVGRITQGNGVSAYVHAITDTGRRWLREHL